MTRALLTSFLLLTAPVAHADADAWRASYAAEARGDYAAARAALAGADGYVAELRTAWLLYLEARHEQAIAAYDRAIAARPASVEARLGKTLPLMASRRWQDAERELRGVRDDVPGDATAATRHAWCLYNLGRYAEAVEIYRAVADAWPADADVAAGLGWSLLQLGRTAEATQVFRGVLAWAPDHASATAGLAAAR